jgi:hypothetical protein
MLSTEIIGKVSHGRQRILVESIFNGLLGEQTTIFQIPCFMSSDYSSFFVYLNHMDNKKFNKTTLFNLVDTAEKTSDECKRIVFILAKDNKNSNFVDMEKMFSVIDAIKMPNTQIEAICNPKEHLSVQREYGFYELQL